jgi:conjugal transfer pilus assembly protein TraE
MIDKIYKLNMQHLAFQRNAFLTLTFLMAVSVSILVVILSLKNEKIIVVPHSLNEKVWAKGNRVSESYLKQQANIVTMLLLSKTLSSSKEQADSLLEITDPTLYGKLRQKLADEQKVLAKEAVSYIFVPSKVIVNESSMSVVTVGERSTYTAKKTLTTVSEKYTYKFKFNGQNLLLSEINREELQSE